MSNFHAKISYNTVARQGASSTQSIGFHLTDVGSTNRTWLRLSAEGEQSNLHPLKVGDILKIGSTVFVVESSDIHNLKNMPVINKRAQNGAQGVGQGNGFSNEPGLIEGDGDADGGPMVNGMESDELMMEEDAKNDLEIDQIRGDLLG
jgi:hypothetical protein